MEATTSNITPEDEQRLIVRFLLTLDRHKKPQRIHKQLSRVYKDDVISFDKLANWCIEFKEINNELPREKIERDICLHRAEVPWRRTDLSSEGNEHPTTEVILKYVLRVLNKITEENFAVHLELIKSFSIDTEDCLRKVVKLFLSHVCEEHKYSNLYAKLCAHLYSKYVPYDDQIIGACPMYITFGELIRTGCEEELKWRLKQSESEQFDSSFPLRYKLRGLIIFMAELYMINALPIEIVHDEYLGLLFDDADTNLFKIECSYISLFKIGKYLELQSNKTLPKFQKEKLDSYFTKMSKLLENDSRKLPLFLHFMILGLIELRSRNWIPKIQESPEYFPYKKMKFKKFNVPKRGESFKIKPPLFILKRNSSEVNKVEWKIRSCMNKMTDSNFASILEQILALPLELYLINIVILIVNKAAREPLFSTLYAELCRQLCSTKKLSNENNQQQESSFKQLLLNECDRIWDEKIRNDSNVIDEKSWNDYKILSKGLVKFFTELYKVGILSNDIINSYILTLFVESEHTLIKIEFLCNFLTYIGEDLEKENLEKMECYFSNIKTFYEKIPKFPNRIRFMLLDLLELRERKWLPRVPVQILDDVKEKQFTNQSRKNRNRNSNKVLPSRTKDLSHVDGNESKGSRIFSRPPRFLKKINNKAQTSNSNADQNTINVYDVPCLPNETHDSVVTKNDNVDDTK